MGASEGFWLKSGSGGKVGRGVRSEFAGPIWAFMIYIVKVRTLVHAPSREGNPSKDDRVPPEET